jgi:hypothetical protein
LYQPTAHGAQPRPAYPGRHTHASECTEPAKSVVSFAPQAQQPLATAQAPDATDALPTASLKVATGQASHAPDASRKPALQRHEPAPEAVAGCAFAGQL